MITDKSKLGRYNSLDWTQREIAMIECGVWPEMQGLDPRFTIGGVFDTANDINSFRNGNPSFELTPERKQKLERLLIKIDSIQKNLNFILWRFPLIVVPSGQIRGKSYSHWIKNEDRKEHYPRQMLKFDIDDGCSRAVAYTLDGLEKAPFYIGLRQN